MLVHPIDRLAFMRLQLLCISMPSRNHCRQIFRAARMATLDTTLFTSAVSSFAYTIWSKIEHWRARLCTAEVVLCRAEVGMSDKQRGVVRVANALWTTLVKMVNVFDWCEMYQQTWMALQYMYNI